MKRLVLIAAAACCLLASCATLGDGRATGLRVAEYINKGQADNLLKLSSTPFMVDRDIVNLPADVAVFWRALVATGFKLDPKPVIQIVPRDPAGILLYGDSMEIRTFFAKYVDPHAVLVELKARDGRKVLLILKDQGVKSVLYGLKGPY